MRKLIYIIVFIFEFSLNAHSFKKFVEQIDYFIDFSEKPPEMASVLHVNFANVLPNPKEAEKIVRQQLRIYGNSIIFRNNKAFYEATKKKTNPKNIIGSAWYHINDTWHVTNPIKIKFQKDIAAYVWIAKTGEIVTFPNYLQFLKKEKNNRVLEDKIL
ncbi:MAG: hypothetical protein LBS78_00805 [Endomicrobium sp.]|jgi:hypothetical protein|nr:hypothetical protein [Endomicrobium sp.]